MRSPPPGDRVGARTPDQRQLPPKIGTLAGEREAAPGLVEIQAEAVPVPRHVRQRAMPGGEVELNVADTLGCAVRSFRFVEHPAVGQRRDNPLLGVGDRIQYGLRLGAHYAGYVDTRAPSFDVPIPFDLGEYRLVVMVDDYAEDLEHSSNWLVFTCQDIEQRIALLVGGATLQDGLHMPVAVMDSTREVEGGDDD